MASLLAVVAVLLGLNIVRGATPAWARQDAGPAPAPTVVAGHVASAGGGGGTYTFALWRFWSDGAVDLSIRDIASSPNASGVVGCDPGIHGKLYDCGPSPVLTATCTADANRNAEVEINDLLTLLGQWGPCR